MSEYDIKFSENLAEVANHLILHDITELEAKRTVLYLSLLSIEISFKAMLEQAGYPVSKIRRQSHCLNNLLLLLISCKIKTKIEKYTSAGLRLRVLTINYGESETILNNTIEAEQKGASKYPNQIRYGNLLRHYPPKAVAQAASKVVQFAKKHWSSIYWSPEQDVELSKTEKKCPL